MILPALLVVAQLLSAAPPNRPVLAFPEPGVDDTLAYAGYQTRIFRDAERNTLQIYLDRREGRVVHLLANADNESIGLSARDAADRPAAIRWNGDELAVRRAASGRARIASYALVADAPAVSLGRFVLGSMRVERDVQYSGAHRAEFSAPAFLLPEYGQLVGAIARAPRAEQAVALRTLRAPSLVALRVRLTPLLLARREGGPAVIQQLSLDGLDTMTVSITAGRGARLRAVSPLRIDLTATTGDTVPFTITISTTGRSLTPLTRDEIFTSDFLRFADSVAAGPDRLRARWIERQIRGVELLSSREKLMAGLPTYATYFGRDMLMSALMMQPIWREQMSEFVIGAALRKLAPGGDVSHEEALGGQAVREAASEFAALMLRADSLAAGDRATARTLRARAQRALRERRTARENYHMIDDEYQLPIMVARYLLDDRVPADRKRAFLRETAGPTGTGVTGGRTPAADSRLARLLAELAVVADQTAPYAERAVAANLVSFAPRDVVGDVTRWSSQSWRDSGAGYANGRYPMDLNAIYAPHALMAMQQILGAVRALGFATDSVLRAVPALQRRVVRSTAFSHYLRDSTALARAITTWKGAGAHFVVQHSAATVRAMTAARVSAMPAAERAWWESRARIVPDSIAFLALALDAAGDPIGVANTDPATGLFLDGLTQHPRVDAAALPALRRDVSLFARPYPEGLFVENVGPAVSNDAYATPAVWTSFRDDPYHGPRVVWGREVNLFLLGVASHLAALPPQSDDARDLRDAASRIQRAVSASGFHSELWSYGFASGRPAAMRYGSGADVQLWSTTDLAVQYVWSRIAR